MMANASALTYFSYHWLVGKFGAGKPVLLMVAALVFFFANTLPISIVIALTEGKSSRKVWAECYFWSFPYYLVGAAAVGLVGLVNRQAGWQTSLLVLPLIYWVYRSYRLYLGRLEAENDRVEVEKRHVEEIAIGARILAVVDCLDALASDRQYRPAMALGAAMAKVSEEAGSWFDPKVVEILERRYIELEHMAQSVELTGMPLGLRPEVHVE